MIVSDFCTMYCGNCSFSDGIDFLSTPSKYRCAFDKECYDCYHKCHLELEPVRHGRWIRLDNTFTRYMCSECRCIGYEAYEKYCPNCGAKMDL